jgi:S-adenosylmethionine:tRNA ribosyltransferase-isomerase
VELVLIRHLGEGRWLAMGKPGRALRPGIKLAFADGQLLAEVMLRTPEGRVELLFTPADIDPILAEFGQIPLPPYIRRDATAVDTGRYQTVFAREPGAIAAPTAGLHFTDGLLEQIRTAGTAVLPILLHVGPGTFEPVRCEDPREHSLEGEYFEVGAEVAAELNRRRVCGRAVAVGTTVVRTLETVADARGQIGGSCGWSEKFIYPPYTFAAVDALVTNFHLPKSTLLMLVAAFAGYENLMNAYREAVREGYRFYSYGDAMMVI